jgi:ParB-like chromosome segregation protein Spo0J
MASLVERAEALAADLQKLPMDERIEQLNAVRRALHVASPFRDEPVDCVVWVRGDTVLGNDYNPNSVAPPEMELLRHSIAEDGYTQPIVTWQTRDLHEVVDGFHRHRVGTEDDQVRERVQGHLPLVVINDSRIGRGDRIAATIRHNRARGKHSITGMSNIVLELKRRNWSDKKIGQELGMDPDEVLRLAQITGLAEMFADRDFSEAWEAADAELITDEDRIDTDGEDANAAGVDAV